MEPSLPSGQSSPASGPGGSPYSSESARSQAVALTSMPRASHVEPANTTPLGFVEINGKRYQLEMEIYRVGPPEESVSQELADEVLSRNVDGKQVLHHVGDLSKEITKSYGNSVEHTPLEFDKGGAVFAQEEQEEVLHTDFSANHPCTSDYPGVTNTKAAYEKIEYFLNASGQAPESPEGADGGNSPEGARSLPGGGFAARLRLKALDTSGLGARVRLQPLPVTPPVLSLPDAPPPMPAVTRGVPPHLRGTANKSAGAFREKRVPPHMRTSSYRPPERRTLPFSTQMGYKLDALLQVSAPPPPGIERELGAMIRPDTEESQLDDAKLTRLAQGFSYLLSKGVIAREQIFGEGGQFKLSLDEIKGSWSGWCASLEQTSPPADKKVSLFINKMNHVMLSTADSHEELTPARLMELFPPTLTDANQLDDQGYENIGTLIGIALQRDYVDPVELFDSNGSFKLTFKEFRNLFDLKLYRQFTQEFSPMRRAEPIPDLQGKIQFNINTLKPEEVGSYTKRDLSNILPISDVKRISDIYTLSKAIVFLKEKGIIHEGEGFDGGRFTLDEAQLREIVVAWFSRLED
ncbi:MAG: hypothetical protein MRY21_02490 [Simkaniaceae bacterium]|nr:hypothetical protein [Simkaniaceae bacterium]